MNTLVIGGTGFLSGAVVQEAQDAGHNVTVLTRGRENRPAPPPCVRVLTADRTDKAALQAALASSGQTFDLVIDCVLFKPDDARAAVEIFQNKTSAYVFISSDFVYGGQPRDFPLDEQTPRFALNSYGKDKAACEDILLAAFHAAQFPCVLLRPPHIMGRGSLLGTGSLAGRDKWLLWKLRNKHPIFLLDNGELLIQPVHKTDIARAALAAFVRISQTRGRAYNVAGPNCVTTRRYYEMVCESAGLPASHLKAASLPSLAYVGAYPNNAPFAQNRAYSTVQLGRDAQFIPAISLQTSISEVVAEYGEKGDPAGDPPPEKATLLAALSDTAPVANLLKGSL